MSETNIEEKTQPDIHQPQGKDGLESKSIWGGVLLLAPVIDPYLSKYGISLNDLSPVADLVAATIGAVLVVWGRISAKHPITSIAGVKLNAKS